MFLSKFRASFAPLILVIGLSLLVLLALYGSGYRRAHEVGSWAAHATGVHAPEQAGGLWYAYTSGDAVLRFPEIGAGYSALVARLGGPAGTAPVAAHLGTSAGEVDLGAIEGIRVYHLLGRADARGDLRLRVTSATRQLASDPRPLGVLVGNIVVRSMGATAPPRSLFVTLPLAIGLLWVATAGLPTTIRPKVAIALLTPAVLGLAFALFRGQVGLQPWILAVAVSALGGMLLSRSQRAIPTSWRGVAGVFVLWRVALWIIGALGVRYSQSIYRLGRGIAFDFGNARLSENASAWQMFGAAWMQWDGKHYQDIALNGYRFGGEGLPTVAFFPLYPLLIRVLLPLTGHNSVVAALLVSNLAMFAAVLLLYDLVAVDIGPAIAYRTVLLLMIFPTSFFLVAALTESLALALAIASVWAMRRQRWWLAGAAGFGLALARVPGVLIAVVLLVSYLQARRWNWRAIRPDALAALLPPLGLALFMLYQWSRFGTPFAFLIAQGSWNNGAAPPWVILGKMLMNVKSSPEWEMAAFQICIWAGFLALTLYALRRLPLPYGLTALLLLLPAYLASQRGSLPRHVLIAFPVFVALACVMDRAWPRWLLVSATLPLLVFLTMLFVNGFGLA